MIKMLIGLLTYKIKNRKLFSEDLSKYPDGMEKLHGTLDFMGDLKEVLWGNFILFLSYF